MCVRVLDVLSKQFISNSFFQGLAAAAATIARPFKCLLCSKFIELVFCQHVTTRYLTMNKI